MLSPAVLFTAITTFCFISQSNCDPDPTQDIDFRSILELVQHQVSPNDREVKDGRYESDSNEVDRKHYGSLRSQEIVELIHKATQNTEFQADRDDEDDAVKLKKVSSIKYRNTDDTESDRYFYKELSENKLNDGSLYGYQTSKKRNKYYINDDKHRQQNRFNEEALDQLLSENVLDKKSQGKQRYKLVPNDLLDSMELKNHRAEEASTDNLAAYSQVYVVLNPSAIAKSTNKNKLNKLLTKILSLTTSRHELDLEKRTRESRYKGFPVLQDVFSRRARRESRENSLEDDYKPKRVRSEYASGGGGGGRTAIPYIRHRGDIYERDD